MTNGANALKIDEEVKNETESQEASTTNSAEEVVSSAIVEEEFNSVEDQISRVDEQPIEKQETENFPSNGSRRDDFVGPKMSKIRATIAICWPSEHFYLDLGGWEGVSNH